MTIKHLKKIIISKTPKNKLPNCHGSSCCFLGFTDICSRKYTHYVRYSLQLVSLGINTQLGTVLRIIEMIGLIWPPDVEIDWLSCGEPYVVTVVGVIGAGSPKAIDVSGSPDIPNDCLQLFPCVEGHQMTIYSSAGFVGFKPVGFLVELKVIVTRC